MEDEGEEFSPPVLEPAMSLSPAADSFPMPPELDTPSSQALLLHNIPKVEGNISLFHIILGCRCVHGKNQPLPHTSENE